MTTTHRAPTTTRGPVRRAVGALQHVVAWTVILAIGGILAVSVVVPRVTGSTPYTILTGSMRPHMPPGTLVVVKPVDADHLSVGTVVTYQLNSGKPTVVTHRIVAVSEDSSGKTIYRTQGDANPTPDPTWVMPVQVKGELWYDVPYLGYVTNAVTGKQRQVATVLVVGFLLAYATAMLGGAALDRRRDRRHRNEHQEARA